MIISVFCMIIGACILLGSLFLGYVFIEEFILGSSLFEMLNINFFSIFMLLIFFGLIGFGGLVTKFKNSLPKEELCYTEDEINIPEQTTPKPEPINEKYEQVQFKDL